MKNQPNKATVKDGLPTAEQIAQWVIDNRYPKSENNKLSDSEMYHSLVVDIQEYSDQQNAELDKMAEQLSAENSHLSSIIEGLKIDKEWLSERVRELQAKIASYESAIDGLKKVVDSLVKIKTLW